MARNGSGTFSRLYDWSDDAAAGVKISSTRMDAEMDGMATALTDSIAKDGQTTPTAALPMGTYNHTNVGAATARTHYTRASQTQDSSIVYASAGGTADAITLTLAPAITAYAAGQKFHFIASGTNTGAVTLNVNGVGATAVKKGGGNALVAGDIVSGQACDVVHDGTDFELLNPAAVTIAGTQTITGDKTFTGSVTLSGAVIQGASPLVFEGASADAFETTIAVTDPTADRTITLPNATGTAVLSPTTGFGVTVLAAGGGISTPADTTEDTLATITVPANAMGANGAFRVTCCISTNNNANAKQIRVRYSGGAGNAFADFNCASAVTGSLMVFVGNRNATNAQDGFAWGQVGGANPDVETYGSSVAATVDTTASTTIVITGQKNTAGDTLTLAHYTVELMPSA